MITGARQSFQFFRQKAWFLGNNLFESCIGHITITEPMLINMSIFGYIKIK